MSNSGTIGAGNNCPHPRRSEVGRALPPLAVLVGSAGMRGLLPSGCAARSGGSTQEQDSAASRQGRHGFCQKTSVPCPFPATGTSGSLPTWWLQRPSGCHSAESPPRETGGRQLCRAPVGWPLRRVILWGWTSAQPQSLLRMSSSLQSRPPSLQLLGCGPSVHPSHKLRYVTTAGDQ